MWINKAAWQKAGRWATRERCETEVRRERQPKCSRHPGTGRNAFGGGPPKGSVQHQEYINSTCAAALVSRAKTGNTAQLWATGLDCDAGSKRVEVRRCRVRDHQATEQNLTRPLSGPDRVQESTGESCEHKPRRKRDESTNYGATFQRSVGHRLGGRQRSDAFDVAKRLQGSARARHLETQKVRRVLNCDAGAGVRQDRGDRDSKRVSESPAGCTFVGKRRGLATPGDARQLRSCASSEQYWKQTDFQKKSRGEVITSLACVMPALQSNAKDKRATDGVWTILLAPMTARTGPTHKAVTLDRYFSTFSQVKFSQTRQFSRVGIPVSDEHRHFAVNTLEETCWEIVAGPYTDKELGRIFTDGISPPRVLPRRGSLRENGTKFWDTETSQDLQEGTLREATSPPETRTTSQGRG